MELMLLVYAIGLLGKLYASLGILTIVLGGLIIIITLNLIVDSPTDFDFKYHKSNADRYVASKPVKVKYIKRLAIAICTAVTIMTLLPTEKTAYVMVAAYATQKVATHPGTEEIGTKVLKIINQNLDKYVDAK